MQQDLVSVALGGFLCALFFMGLIGLMKWSRRRYNRKHGIE